MPFDGKNFDEPKVLSFDGLVRWLETQEPEAAYDWEDCHGGCLLGLYAAATLGKVGGPNDFGPGFDAFNALHREAFRGGWLHVACREPHTFGAALARAKALRP